MQRGIDSYFIKKAVQKPQKSIPCKRKALTISSDEEDTAGKVSPKKSNKRSKVVKTSSPHNNKSADVSKKLKPIDILAVFGGEASRETKKQSNLASAFEEENKDNLKNSPHSTKPKSPNKDESTPLLHASPESPKVHSIKKSPKKSEVIVEKDNAKKNGQKPIKEEAVETIEDSSPVEDTKKKKGSKHSDLETSILSDEERFERKRMAAVLYQKFKNRQSVINPGSKEVPKGKPNCLAGLSFLVTGVLESLERDEANSIIKELGGKTCTTVGKRLNYLIAGEDSGPKKLADAESLGIPILNVDQFFELIREKSNLSSGADSGKKSLETNVPKKKKSPVKRKQDEKEHISTIKIKKEEKEETSVKKIKVEQHETQSTDTLKPDALSVKAEDENLAWVEKYKPTSVKQIIGQQGAASNCVKLLNWLTKWHTNHNGSKKMQKPNPWAKNDDGSFFKAALLSGPPGVGKTTTATLVCKELGFDVVEFNASDTRSKRLLKEEVSELLSNKSLYGYFHGSTQVVSKKHVLIMDEVDGMAGNEDRGGIQELIALIKDSHVPIICMCNDRNHQKMRSLVNYCYDLRFSRPRLEQIKGFMRSICFKEKIKLSPEKIDEIILATNNDIRQSVNHLCLLSAGKELEPKSNVAKTAQKDLKMGPWEVVRKVFSVEEHKTMSLADKSDLFFHDYSMAPLFVQQNYLIVSPSGPKSEVLKKVALTADALSLGDLVDRRIRSNSAWTLLPVQAVLSSVLPGQFMEGHITGQINFPGWLGKFSRTNKRSRLAQEIHDHTRLRTSGSRLSIRMDYAPFLLSNIVRPLKENGLDGVEESLKVLQEYRLLREDIDSLVELTTWPGKKSQMDAVDGRVKAALTRTYNKEVLPYSYSAITAVKKKTKEISDGDLMDIMENEESMAPLVESEEENDNTLENDNLIKAKKKPASSSSKATTSKASAGKKAASGSGKPKAKGSKI